MTTPSATLLLNDPHDSSMDTLALVCGTGHDVALPDPVIVLGCEQVAVGVDVSENANAGDFESGSESTGAGAVAAWYAIH